MTTKLSDVDSSLNDVLKRTTDLEVGIYCTAICSVVSRCKAC